VARRKKVNAAAMTLDELAAMPGMLDVRMFDTRDSLWRPHEKRLVTGSPAGAEAWMAKLRSVGFMDREELDEEQNRMRAIIKAAQQGGAYDPASVANKKSGYGTKPSRKPTRDYKAPASVRNNGTYVGTRTGAGWTPS
jgi:hypothetical protein